MSTREVIFFQTVLSKLSGNVGDTIFHTIESDKIITQAYPTMPPHQWTPERLNHNRKFLQAIEYAKLHYTETQYAEILENHPNLRNQFAACVWKWFLDYEPPQGLEIDFSDPSHCLPEAEGGIWNYNHWTLRTYQHESGANPPRLFVKHRGAYFPERPYCYTTFSGFSGQEITFEITIEDCALNTYILYWWMSLTYPENIGNYTAYGTPINPIIRLCRNYQIGTWTHTFTPTGDFCLQFNMAGSWSSGWYSNTFLDNLKIITT